MKEITYNDVKLGQKVYHGCDRGYFVVTGITTEKVQLYGDWSGGTHPQTACKDWVDYSEIAFVPIEPDPAYKLKEMIKNSPKWKELNQ